MTPKNKNEEKKDDFKLFCMRKDCINIRMKNEIYCPIHIHSPDTKLSNFTDEEIDTAVNKFIDEHTEEETERLIKNIDIVEEKVFSKLSNSIWTTEEIYAEYELGNGEPEKQWLPADEVRERIEQHKNPYPKDIFSWNNKNKIELTRGRFNEFIHKIVENTKEDILKELELKL